MAYSKDPIIKVLDTTIADTGPTQVSDFSFLKEDQPMRMHCSLGSGDTIVIESKLESADSFQTIATFAVGTPGPFDVYVGRFWRARRTVDGGSADSVVDVQNTFVQNLQIHTT